MVDQASCNLTTEEARNLADSLPVEEMVQELADFLKVFGDPTRIRVLFLLRDRELCVHDICEVTISHQLKTLRQALLVRHRKEGKMVFYTINDDHIDALLNVALEHIKE